MWRALVRAGKPVKQYDPTVITCKHAMLSLTADISKKQVTVVVGRTAAHHNYAAEVV